MADSSTPVTIGVCTPYIGGFYLGELISALLSAARQKGARLLVMRTGNFGKTDTVFGGQQVDGWVVIVRSLSQTGMIRLASSGKPVSCIGVDPGIPGIQPILSGNHAGVSAAMQNLHALGRKRFAFVGFLKEFDIGQRWEAYRDFIAGHGLESSAEWVVDTGSYEVLGGYTAADELLKHSPVMPDAILCGNDQNANGVITRLREAGIRVPADVAVVGYDDSSLARTTEPPMASVSQDSLGMAEQAIASLLEGRIQHDQPPAPLIIPARYVPRRSAGEDVESEPERETWVSAAEFMNSLSLGDEIMKFLLTNPAERIHELLPRIDPDMRWSLVARQDPNSGLLHAQHVFAPGCTVRLDRLSVEEASFPPLHAFEEEGRCDGCVIAVMPVIALGTLRSVVAVGVGPGISTNSRHPLVLAHLLELLAFGLERASINDALEARVENRTHELNKLNHQLEDTLDTLRNTQAELVRSEKLASLGSLVAGVAHELNTPLGNSLMLSSTVEEDARILESQLDEGSLRRITLEEFVSRVREASSRLSSNISIAANMVNDFKRLATQQHAETRQNFSLYELIRDSLHQLRQEHFGTSLVVRAFSDVMLVSYPFALTECLIELVKNAIQHGLEGKRGGQVEISVNPLEEGLIEIVVEDNGTGIPPANIDRVFDPFFTTRLGMQRGLGLNTVFNFVTGILGGHITVKNRPDSGARFSIQIPILAPEPLLDNPSCTLDQQGFGRTS